MIDCVTFENFISDYLDGTLSARQRFVFEMHLRLCRECRVYLKEYQLAVAMAEAEGDKGFAEMGLGEVPEDLIQAVIDAQKDKRPD